MCPIFQISKFEYVDQKVILGLSHVIRFPKEDQFKIRSSIGPELFVRYFSQSIRYDHLM